MYPRGLWIDERVKLLIVNPSITTGPFDESGRAIGLFAVSTQHVAKTTSTCCKYHLIMLQIPPQHVASTTSTCCNYHLNMLQIPPQNVAITISTCCKYHLNMLQLPSQHAANTTSTCCNPKKTFTTFVMAVFFQ